MSSSLLFLYSGDSQRREIEVLAEAILELGLRVTMEDLDSGDYHRILDAIELSDTVIHWPAPRGD